MSSEKYSQALALVKAGKKVHARPLLLQVVQEDNHNVAAWIWLAECTTDAKQRVLLMQQCLKFNPGDPLARRALAQYLTQSEALVPPAPFIEPEQPEVKLFSFLDYGEKFSPSEPPKQPAHVYTPRDFRGDSEEPKTPSPSPFIGLEENNEEYIELSPPPPEEPPVVEKPRRSRKFDPRWRFFLLGAAFMALISAAAYMFLIRPGTPVAQSPTATTAVTAPALTPAVSKTLAPTLQVTSPAPSPTLTSTPPIVVADYTLPAPLYYLSSLDGQIWRLPADGSALEQITRLDAPVDGFDISPVDGAIAYITNNQLWLAGADGTQPHMLVDGGTSCDPNNTVLYWRYCLRGIAWAPDGKQLALGQNGVSLVDPVTGELFKIALNGADERYFPVHFSPDGKYVVVEAAGEIPRPGIVPVWGGLVVAKNASACCQIEFLPDGKTMLVGNNDFANGGRAGFWRVNLNSGAVNVLINGAQENASLAFPKLAPDGITLWYFGVLDIKTPGAPEFLASAPLSDPLKGRTEWKGHDKVDLFPEIYEALWSADASLVVIYYNNPASSVALVDVPGGKVTPLPVRGYHLRWGK